MHRVKGDIKDQGQTLVRDTLKKVTEIFFLEIA